MDLECEICRNGIAVTLADGMPMCDDCRVENEPHEAIGISEVDRDA